MKKNSYFKLAGALGVITISLVSWSSMHETHNKGYDTALMNKTVDPCTDFYSYAIGGWLKMNPIPSTESRWGTFNILNKQNEEKVQKILDNLLALKIAYTKGSVEQLVRDQYQAALDTGMHEKTGKDGLKEDFKQIEAFTTKKVASFIAAQKKKGKGGLFGFYVGIDAKNSSQYIANFSQGGLGMPDVDYYTKTDAQSIEIQNAYIKHINNMLQLAKVVYKGDAGSKIWAIEKELALISMTRTQRRDPDKTYNKMSYTEFISKYNYTDWSGFFKTIAPVSINEMVVAQTDFFANLGNVLSKFTDEEWKVYFKWHLINNMSGTLGSDFEKEHFHFYATTLRGTKQMKPRTEIAVNTVNGSLGEPLGQLFVKQHFSPESKQKVSTMVEELRDAFRDRIKQLEWMSDSTKNKALEKLNAFTYKIGYPDKWKDYSSVIITPNNLYANMSNIAAFQFTEMVNKLGKPIDKTEWGMTPQTVNAYYNSSRNEIVFPAGILQYPFFDPNADDALNYGGIGAVIGHEFSHGFDDKGSKYDAQGNLNNWWSTDDRTRFEQRTKKIIEQFSRFEVLDSLYINGSMTQGENIADLAGLTLAYYALQKHLQNDPKYHGPHDGFSWKQRFFLGWSLVWAQNITDKELRNRIITDPHSPGKYRVMGPLANMPEFWDAFGCHQQGPMHATDEHRVILW